MIFQKENMKKEPDTKGKSKAWSLGSCWEVKQAQCSETLQLRFNRKHISTSSPITPATNWDFRIINFNFLRVQVESLSSHYLPFFCIISYIASTELQGSDGIEWLNSPFI